MAVSGGAGGGSLRLMSCVRETSPPDIVDAEETRHEPKKRRFHPLRGLRRMFRRKARTPEVERETLGNSDAQSLEARSQSASQLLDDNNRRRSGGNLQSSGLSVSHDSIFSPEQQLADSGSELESTSSLSIQRLILAQSGIRAELVDAVRRRRGREDEPSDEEEDLGLPRSPCSNSPTTADVLFEKVLKETTNKSSHSTCSDGSLLSMGSSEMDEDSYGQSSRHSSKLSLQDKRNLVSSDLSPSHGLHIIHGATQLEVGVDQVTTTPLSHSAAKHKMAVKPKRTHGAPRRRRLHQIGGGSLPVTPEVNEDGSHSGRSVTPDVETNNVSAQPDDAVAVATPACSSNTNLPSATQLKSASLPPGLAPVLSNWNDSSSPVKLSRSRSSATNRQLDPNPSSIIENDENSEIQQNKKEDMSFFGRLLSRRSGKKKKFVDEKESSIVTTAPPLELPQKRMDEKGRYVHEVTKLSRNHPAARQRVEPINIPSECPTSVTRMHVSYSAPTPPLSPELKKVAKDDLSILKQPNNKIMSLNKDDLFYEKKTLVTKSYSFRSNKDNEENIQFTSLDTDALVSLPINLQTNNEDKKPGKLGEDEASQKGDLESPEETVGQGEELEKNVCNVLDINNDKNIGVLNKSLVQDFVTSSSNVVTETKDSSSITNSDKKEGFKSGGIYIKSSMSASNNDAKELINLKHDNNEVFIKNISNSSLTSIDQNSVVIENCEMSSRKSSVESLSHQVTTIPIGTSIVNIINNNSPTDGQKSDDFDDFSGGDNLENNMSVVDNINSTNFQISSENKEISSSTSHMTVISSDSNDIFNVKSENSKIKTPEPKSRTQNQIQSDESLSSTGSSSSFIPVPAPRLSKRESLHKLSPPNVPEFLKVQLNHIDNKPQTTNVVLSKLLSDSDNVGTIQENINLNVNTSKCNDVIHDECDNFNECDMKSLEEVEIEQDHIIASSVTKSQVPVVTAVTDKPNENVSKVNESKQRSSPQTLPHQQSQPVPNPRYSIVSITANSNSSENQSLKYKPDNQIVRKKSIVKDSNGYVTEKLYNSSDKSSFINDNKNELENSSIKHILRKKSFNKDGHFYDKSSPAVNTTSLLRSSSENIADVPKVVDEIIPKVVLRQKPLVNDVIIVETQQKNRKSSLETLQQVSTKNCNISDKNASNDVSSKYMNGSENVKEKYRNSFGSCDTLLSQDSSTSLDVVYRRKSLTSREVITKQKDKDDEPELLKVFARRSLKIKDTDINLQNNDLDVINTNASSTNNMKSRDSDKENDCGDSPPEERKKIKDSFIESKTENTVDNTVQVFNLKTNSLRTQRSFSVNTEDVNTNVNVLSSIHKENNQNSYEKRQRSRTFPDNQKIIEPPNVMNALNQQEKPSINNIFVEKDVQVISKQEVVTLNHASENNKEENDVPLFKRIQQRKEEWEKRAQLAMKRTHP